MEDAWWQPVMPSAADGSLVGLVAERQYPGQFIVNGAGERFVNEATPYITSARRCSRVIGPASATSPAGRSSTRRRGSATSSPAICPACRCRSRGSRPVPRFRAATLEELARLIGIEPAALRRTAGRYNALVDRGRDDDFHRGESAYDRYYGDPLPESEPGPGRPAAVLRVRDHARRPRHQGRPVTDEDAGCCAATVRRSRACTRRQRLGFGDGDQVRGPGRHARSGYDVRLSGGATHRRCAAGSDRLGGVGRADAGGAPRGMSCEDPR